MRVVHLTQSTTAEITGGLEHHIAYLTDALKQRGHEVIVVSAASFAAPAAAVEAREAGFDEAHGGSASHGLIRFLHHEMDVISETLAMFGRRLFKARYALRVARHVDSLKPDLVHQHSYLEGLSSSRLISRKYPLVFTNHTGAYLHLDRLAPTRFLQRQLMKRFTMVIGPSHELLPRTDNSHYVPNGVDTNKFFPVSEEERERLKIKHDCEGKRVFVCPRRWAPTKGIIYLAKALALLRPETRAKCVFIFAGNETPGYDKYQQNVRLALAAVKGGKVRVLGNLDHKTLAELMNISEACVVPSLMEATSLACLEAMACAAPVIGTETGGLLELIRHGENGWLIPLRDERALAARIEEIVAADPDNLRQIRKAAVETVRERYTWTAAAQETEKIYVAAMQKWRQKPCNYH
jgi:glycosyltransferase involved in cell wall biosynthesis